MECSLYHCSYCTAAIWSTVVDNAFASTLIPWHSKKCCTCSIDAIASSFKLWNGCLVFSVPFNVTPTFFIFIVALLSTSNIGHEIYTYTTLVPALPCVTQRLLCSQYLRGIRQLLWPFTVIDMCCLLYFITPVVKRNSNCSCLLHYADVEKRRVTCGCALFSLCVENKENITCCKKCASRTEKLTFYIY